jgi:hypothetical protein
MSKVTNVGYTDTAIAGVTSLAFARGLVNYKADFRAKSNTPSEVVLTNLTSPVDRPEKFRFSYSDVANVYSGTDVDPSVYAPSKKGVSVLCQVTETISITDSTDATFRIDLPISAHVVLKVPANEYLTADMLQTFMGRLVSGMYETGSLTTERIQALVRGSLLPADL